MARSNLYGKDLICTRDWSVNELNAALDLAVEMKENRFSEEHMKILRGRTFLMFFYNPSVRTRQSFECAASELGGHAQFLEPKSMRLKTKQSAGETIEDAAKVMSRYGCGIGIRILEDKIEAYGDGDALLVEYAKYASIPIINMADDRFHPCQGLADVMGLRQHLDTRDFKGKKLLQVWSHGALARSWCSVQESILINSAFGMDVTLAYPEGYDLDPEVVAEVKANCRKNGAKFEIVHDAAEGYEGADVVYARNWMSPGAYENGFDKEAEVKKALPYKEWICDARKMKRSNNALFIHPMPVDRGHEVTDEVASGPRSIMYDVAENRLHVQKAVMALTMGE